MIYTQMTKKAILFAYNAHYGQFDKSGIPYILHPFHVAESMRDEDSTTVALLHDIIEDTKYNKEDLINAGFPNYIVDAVVALSRRSNESYMDYIRRVKRNNIAKAVKLADLEHNSDLSRIDKITEDDLKRVKKYNKAKNILNEEDT